MSQDPASNDSGRENDALSETEIQSEPKRVWELLTTSDGFSEWMGKGSTIEPWTGGAIETADPATGISRSGRVVEVQEGRSITWTWTPSSPVDGLESEVHILIGPSPIGTRIRVVETPLASGITPGARASVDRSLMTRASAWEWRLAVVLVAATRVVA